MKKITLLLMIILIVLAVGCKKEKEAQPMAIAMKGIVNFIQGDVIVQRGSVDPVALKVGDEVVEGMKVTTKTDKSFAEIYIGENAMKIAGNTSMVFSKMIIEDGGEKTELLVEKGGVFSKITKKLEKNDSVIVKTPQAVAAVRGTEFYVSDDNGRSNIACLDGKVEVAKVESLNQSLVLEKNEQVSVAAGADLVKEQIATDQMNRLKILADIKEIQQDIKQKYEDQRAEMRKLFEEQREEMRKAVVDQRDKDKAMVEAQKATDQANVEAQKAEDKKNIDAIKGESNQAAQDATSASKAAADQTKANTDETKNSAQSAVEQMKAANKANLSQ